MSGALQAMMMRKGVASSDLSISYQFSSSSTTTSHVISASAQAAYARTTTGTGAVWGILSYKVLTAGDVGATLSSLPAGGQGQGSTILYYRPSKAISSVTLVGTAGNEATTGDPAPQTMNVAWNNNPTNVCIAAYVANSAIATRSSTVTMSEIAEKTGNPYAYIKHKAYNIGDTLEYISVDMADYNNNCLQSFFVEVK